VVNRMSVQQRVIANARLPFLFFTKDVGSEVLTSTKCEKNVYCKHLRNTSLYMKPVCTFFVY